MKKLRNNKITASRQLAAVPAHSCSYFIISVSQVAAHWLQCRVRQGLTNYYIDNDMIINNGTESNSKLIFNEKNEVC